MAAAIFGVPVPAIAGSIALGGVFGVIRVVGALVAAVFVHELVVESGRIQGMLSSITGITPDRRLQLILIAFCFGAILEGSGGGGAPVAIVGAMLVTLGFAPFDAVCLALIANTVPVAYGAMGNPVRTLAAVTGYPESMVSTATGRLLFPLALLIPFWLVGRQYGVKDLRVIGGKLLAAGLIFGGLLLASSQFGDLSLVAIVTGLGSMLLLALLFRFQNPAHGALPGSAWRSWIPYLLLVLVIALWGVPGIRDALDRTTIRIPVPGLHNLVYRQPPVVVAPRAEPAVFEIAWLSSSATAAVLAGLLAGPLVGLSLRRTVVILGLVVWRIRWSIVAILAMLSLGFLTRYSGMDAVLGLGLARAALIFPFLSPLIGWLGVLLTGTNAGSNALFGSLQAITAERLGLNPVLTASANAAGGVLGKMVNAQSLVVGCAATQLEGREGDVFRTLFRHSLALAALMGLIVCWFAYVAPAWIPGGQ